METLCPDLDEFISVLSSERKDKKNPPHLDRRRGRKGHLRAIKPFFYTHTTNNNLLFQRHPGVST